MRLWDGILSEMGIYQQLASVAIKDHDEILLDRDSFSTSLRGFESLRSHSSDCEIVNNFVTGRSQNTRIGDLARSADSDCQCDLCSGFLAVSRKWRSWMLKRRRTEVAA